MKDLLLSTRVSRVYPLPASSYHLKLCHKYASTLINEYLSNLYDYEIFKRRILNK